MKQQDEPEGAVKEEARREIWHGMRSAAPELKWVVIGPSVVEKFPELEVWTEMEPRLLTDKGVQTAFQLIEAGAERVAYYGGLEESSVFAAMLAGIAEVEGHLPTDGRFQAQVAQILSLLGLPPRVIQAGLEEFSAGLEAVETGA